MAYQPYDARQEPERLADIIAADEAHPSIGRQIRNGIGGVLVLMVTGMVILLLVLWKSP